MGKILLIHRFTKKMVKENPNIYFVFGDNFEKKGHGGQAIIRDYKNTIGVPTKKYPSNHNSSFMTDDEFEKNKKEIDKAFFKIRDAIKNDYFIALPRDGLGTGLAKLEEKAPETNQYLLKKISKLKKDYGVLNN
jgi:hypothetical protein